MDIILGLKVFAFLGIIVVFISGLIVATQFAISHAYAAAIDADYIHCNWLLCDVGKTYSESITVTEQNCYMNGEPINCTNIP